MVTLSSSFSPTKSPPAAAAHHPNSSKILSVIYRTRSATNQMPCSISVRDSRISPNTPDPSNLDETIPSKSHAAALKFGAARTSPAGPLGLDEESWPPLVIMFTNPPPKVFISPKNQIPPDQLSPPPPIKCRRQNRCHPPNPTSPIRCDTDLIAYLSSIINNIQHQALHELRQIFHDEIYTIPNTITTSLKTALQHTVKQLATKNCTTFSAMQKDISRRQPTLHQRSPPPQRVPSRQQRCALHRDTRQVPRSADEERKSREGSVCLDDGSSQDDCYLSFDGENNGMNVDNEGGKLCIFWLC